MTVSIIGAGLAGLLAANMLRKHNPIIYEAQAELPNNHSAVLRFRSPIVGDVLGIPFKRVQMIKAPLPWRNPVADTLAYSRKCLRSLRSDRSITDGLVVAERFIAPPDLIARMAEGLRIEYDYKALTTKSFSGGNPIISTIPMPALMAILSYPHRPNFNYVPGFNIRARIRHCDAYVSLMVPHPELCYSRISITGDELIIEVPATSSEGRLQMDAAAVQFIASSALAHLGIPDTYVTELERKEQRYAKIAPIDEDARREFLHWATINHNIYSLGRFATWRPGLLLDALVQDVRKIEGWMMSSNKYDVALAK